MYIDFGKDVGLPTGPEKYLEYLHKLQPQQESCYKNNIKSIIQCQNIYCIKMENQCEHWIHEKIKT